MRTLGAWSRVGALYSHRLRMAPTRRRRPATQHHRLAAFTSKAFTSNAGRSSSVSESLLILSSQEGRSVSTSRGRSRRYRGRSNDEFGNQQIFVASSMRRCALATGIGFLARRTRPCRSRQPSCDSHTARSSSMPLVSIAAMSAAFDAIFVAFVEMSVSLPAMFVAFVDTSDCSELMSLS